MLAARLGAALLVGPVIGSFVTNWSLRRVRGEQAVTGRSRCEHCGRELDFLRTLPIVAYATLRGRCDRCRAAIDPIHLGGEIGGALVVAFALGGAWPWEPAARALLGFSLLALTIIDLRTLRLPDALTALAAVACAWLGVLRGAIVEGLAAAVILALVLALLRRLTRRGTTPGLGLGDVKLAAALALWLGLSSSWMLALAAFIGLGWFSLARPANGKLPFGPSLAAAALIIGGLRDLDLWSALP